MYSAWGRGSKTFFQASVFIFLLVWAACNVSEPLGQPLLEKINIEEEKTVFVRRGMLHRGERRRKWSKPINCVYWPLHDLVIYKMKIKVLCQILFVLSPNNHLFCYLNNPKSAKCLYQHISDKTLTSMTCNILSINIFRYFYKNYFIGFLVFHIFSSPHFFGPG